jgi:hypothetical protein
MGNFAGNYSFIVQEAAQGFHWNNQQASQYPFVCYFTNPSSGTEELLHLPMLLSPAT